MVKLEKKPCNGQDFCFLQSDVLMNDALLYFLPRAPRRTELDARYW